MPLAAPSGTPQPDDSRILMGDIPDESLRMLVVDDDEVDRMAIRRSLFKTQLVAEVDEVPDAEAALQAIRSRTYDCVFLDYYLPGMSGLRLVKAIRAEGIGIPLIALTGQGDEDTAVSLMKAGVSDYFTKDRLVSASLKRRIRSVMRVYQAEQAAEQANQRLREKNLLLERQNRELQAQRQRIQQQNLQLIEASRLKSEFLATMSHELRTPLNAIIGFSQLLLRQGKHPLADPQSDMIDRVLSNGKHLLLLINDILDLSKIEAGRLTLKLTDVDLSRLVRATVEELRSLAAQKQLALQADIQLSNPNIYNDPGRLRQCLVNLLSNAIKFTEQGTVSVIARETADGDLQIAVQDTGIGIAEKDMATIFDAFHQVNQTMTRKHSGTGLGLAITRSLVEMMGGAVQVQSCLGSGSTFALTFPRRVSSAMDTSSSRIIELNASPAVLLPRQPAQFDP